MATIIRQIRELSFAGVDATPYDGTTSGLTYQPGDRTITQVTDVSVGLTGACVPLDEETDAVIITMSGTGSDGNSAVFHIHGYGENSPMERIYNEVTATLGTAVAGTGQLYVDTFDGTDLHTETIGIYDSGDNAVCKIKFDTQGLRYLYFEPKTFTTLTAVKFYIREVGQK